MTRQSVMVVESWDLIHFCDAAGRLESSERASFRSLSKWHVALPFSRKRSSWLGKREHTMIGGAQMSGSSALVQANRPVPF